MQTGRKLDFLNRLIGLLLALGVHALAFSWGGMTKTPHVKLERGEVSVRMTLVSSVASKATSVEKPKPKPVLQRKEFLKFPQKNEAQVAVPKQREPKPKSEDPPKKVQEPAEKPTQKELEKSKEPSPNSSEQRGSQKKKGLNSPSQILSREGLNPEYPWISRLKSEQGVVSLRVEVLADGSAGTIKILQSSGHKRLDTAAVEGLEGAEFVPAQKNGKRVRSFLPLNVRFQLEPK